MSDVLPDAAADLLDADESDFDDQEAFRDWVDQRLAELERQLTESGDRLDDHDDRLGEMDALTDALATKADRALDAAEDAEQRAQRAERMAAWGGLGYPERLARVVREVEQRARRDDGAAHITTATESLTDYAGNAYERPGIYDLFDGAVSERTCRNYIDALGECDGLAAAAGTRGGWGGGSSQKRLKINLSAFLDAYGDEWDADDLLADMGGE